MADSSSRSHDIPFVIDDVVKIVKSVTKNTTCNDVLRKLPNLQCPLAVFESVNGVEKQLPGKTKLLKVWRAHGASSKVVFVVKRSEETELKRSRSGIFKLRRLSTKPLNKRKLSGENLKKVSDLAFYVRYQKSKVQNMKRKFEEVDSESEEIVRKLKTITSTSSMDSMDAFLAKADLNKMARFLSFCGEVTDEKLGVRKAPKTSRDQTVHAAEREVKREVKDVNRNIVHSSLRNMKLGFKQRFATNNGNQKTTSAGTISSADTGYHSEKSEDQRPETVVKKPTALPKRHTLLETDQDGLPRHSTPRMGRSSEDNGRLQDCTFSAPEFSEADGKTAILKKFFADHAAMATGADCNTSVGSFTSPDANKRFSLSSFPSQKDLCRFYWDVNCDSDSDSSSVADASDLFNSSKLDNAFIDSFEYNLDDAFVTPRNKTLRRESAVSNLALCTLQAKPINFEDCDNSFDYSFDCTFPRLDESQSVDFTKCFGDDSFQFSGDGKMASLDDTSDVDLTKELLKDICDSDDSFVESDEGLGSMSSGSVQEIMYI